MKKRALILETVSGDSYVFTNISEIFNMFGIPEPNPNADLPVLSMEFRKAVSTLGMVRRDENNNGLLEFIPPHQIKKIKFLLTDDNKKYDKIVKRILKEG